MCEVVLVCVHLLVQDGTTPLYVASAHGHCEVAKMLLEAEANVHMKDNVSESCSSDDVYAQAKSTVCTVSAN